jgi:hypothetical protein
MSGSSAGVRDNSAKSAPGMGAPELSSGVGPPISISGTDYTHATLGQAANRSNSRLPAAAAGTSGEQVPAALDRLLDPGQRAGCLAAIVSADGGTPTAVDFARYQGQPALIVTLAGGTAAAVAVGPDCGLAGSGPAEIDHVAQ